jgi:ribosomal protein L11 methylase PrmA
MFKNNKTIDDFSDDWNLSCEELLLARQLASHLEKNGDHVSISMTNKGIIALVDALTEIREERSPLVDKDNNGMTNLIAKSEVKNQFGVCETTLWLWAKKGYLKPVKIGRRVMYRMSDIKKMVEGGK